MRRRCFAKILLVALLAMSMVGCSDDECTVCPDVQPEHIPDYHLLYSYVGDGDPKYVLTYSTKTGEVIDSANYGVNIFSNMVFSHSGNYACYTSNYNLGLRTSETWVTNWPQGDTVAYLLGTGTLGAYLTEDDRYLLLTGGPLFAILNFPSLAPLLRDSVKFLRDDPSWKGSGSWGAALHPTKRMAYVMFEPYWDSIFVFDYSESPVKLSSHQLIDSQGSIRHSRGPLLCTEEYLIILHSGYLGLFDPLSMNVIKERIVQPHLLHGGRLHPDGHRLFMIFNGGFDWPYGGVDVYDLVTNIMRTYIAEGEIDAGWGGIDPSDLQFTPDGELMYVANGGIGLDNGPMLEIEISTKEVTRRWDHSSGISRLLRINPKDWAK